MQLIVTLDEHHGIQIRCPGCDVFLTTVKEQDDRVHIMHHPPHHKCRWSEQTFRVDRMSGYAEPWPEVREEDQCESSADAIPTNITTSAATPCTTFRSVIRHTPRDTPAAVRGRIIRFRGQG